MHIQGMTFYSLEYKQKCYGQHRLFIFEFTPKSRIFWPKQIIFTGKSNEFWHARDCFEVSPSKRRISFYISPWLLIGTCSFLKQASKRLLLLRSYMGHEVERLPVWPENILSVQTTRGGRRRGGQGGINTAGFNIRSQDRHFALSCGTCLRNQMEHMKSIRKRGGVCGSGTRAGKVLWGLCFPSPLWYIIFPLRLVSTLLVFTNCESSSFCRRIYVFLAS